MLSILKESAAACTSYVRMADLQPGRYEITRFEIRETQYGKRLVIEINQGMMFLPEKMMKKINSESAIKKLNNDRYDLVFEGKENNVLKFDFEKHAATDDEDDDDDETDTEEQQQANKSNKRKTNNNIRNASPKKAKK